MNTAGEWEPGVWRTSSGVETPIGELTNKELQNALYDIRGRGLTSMRGWIRGEAQRLLAVTPLDEETAARGQILLSLATASDDEVRRYWFPQWPELEAEAKKRGFIG